MRQYAYLSLFLPLISNRKWYSLFIPCWHTVCVHCQISVRALGSCERRVKNEKMLEHICIQRNKGSLVFRVLREGMPSYCPCEIHRLFLLVSPSTVGDFPNCKSSPFIVPTNSGWQHSLYCHTPHYNQPTLLQLLSVRVSMSSNVFVALSHPWIVFRENKQNTRKTKIFRENTVHFFFKFQHQNIVTEHFKIELKLHI